MGVFHDYLDSFQANFKLGCGLEIALVDQVRSENNRKTGSLLSRLDLTVALMPSDMITLWIIDLIWV